MYAENSLDFAFHAGITGHPPLTNNADTLIIIGNMYFMSHQRL
jgi:hypothetical protein